MDRKPEVPEKILKKPRGKRGSGITKTPLFHAPLSDDDDPFVACDTKKWSLQEAIDHVKKHHPSKANFNTSSFKNSTITPETFHLFSNTLIIILFRLYAKLEAHLQNTLRMFYFGLEKSNPPRFRNLTNCLRKHNIFRKYPWLITGEKIKKEATKKPVCKRKRNGSHNNDEPKPFSEACKQYEIEKRRSSKIQNKIIPIKIEPEEMANTSYLTNVNEFDENVSDKHLLLSKEYQNMISALNCNYEHEPEILEEYSPKRKKRSRWSSPPSAEETNQITNTTLTPLMHFENRKIKLTTEMPLSLGDLIVLVSYYYKLECIEQQLLIEKMKVLEATKPNQASYLRQYVRTTCPPFDENEIHFKPLPHELIISEVGMDLQHVTCIEDILENDFCVFDDGKQQASNEFDFGSAFL